MFPHHTILGPLFWIVMGWVFAFVIICFKHWTAHVNIRMTWWKWILSIGWFCFLHISVISAFTLLGENETQAGFYIGGIMGVLALISGFILWRILHLGTPRNHVKQESHP